MVVKSTFCEIVVWRSARSTAPPNQHEPAVPRGRALAGDGLLGTVADAAGARPSAEWCASQAAGVDRYLGLAGEALSEGNVGSALARLATAHAIRQASLDAGCETTAV